MLLLALALALAVTACAAAALLRHVPEVDARATWLDAHNRERAAFGVAPLVWDEGLAQAALSYARQLAPTGSLRHAPRWARPGQGENLWIGTQGVFPPATMTANWTAERRHFRRGTFPDVSRTGNLADVGHYAQMVWPKTTWVGCGLASAPQWDVLVCRYSPPGNRDGIGI